LTAAAMAVHHSTLDISTESVYESRGVLTA
jgi:hypothetical protein